MVKRNQIKYHPQCIIVSDETADAVFHAGVELLADIGIYNKDTFRVIKFGRDWCWPTLPRRKKFVPRTSNGSNLGILCRGAEDCAVVMVANLLAELGYGHGTVSIKDPLR